MIKEGTWIKSRMTDQYHFVEKISLESSPSIYCDDGHEFHENEVVPWVPQIGEMVWAYNDPNGVIILGKYEKKMSYGCFLVNFGDSDIHEFLHMEPLVPYGMPRACKTRIGGDVLGWFPVDSDEMRNRNFNK